MKSFTQTVEDFLKEASGLGPQDEPSIKELRYLATLLDEGDAPSWVVKEYGLVSRWLGKKAGDQGSDDDGFFDEV